MPNPSKDITRQRAREIYDELNEEFGEIAESIDELDRKAAGFDDDSKFPIYFSADGALNEALSPKLEGLEPDLLAEIHALAEEADERCGGRLHVNIMVLSRPSPDPQPPTTVWDYLHDHEGAGQEVPG